MKPTVLSSALLLLLLFSTTKGQQASAPTNCFCDLKNVGQVFPMQKLHQIDRTSANCTHTVTKERLMEVEILLDSLHYRLLNLQRDVRNLDEENDDGIYSVISLRIIEIELSEIGDLLLRLNSTSRSHRALTDDLAPQVQVLRSHMEKLAEFDRMQVFKKQQENKRLQTDITYCETQLMMSPAPYTTLAPGNCPFGRLLNVTGPHSKMETEYGTSYPYGSWGMDPKPAPGKEGWYWLVALTRSNIYTNYIRTYSSHSALIVSKNAGDVTITASNPTTNSLIGPGSVMYDNALYYNCYNYPKVCRFDMTTKSIHSVELPGAGYNDKFPYCHLTSCYTYTDIDLSTDESGLWVVYASEANFGNVVLSRLNASITLNITQTWNTSLFKKAISNTFMACGVLYATRYVDKDIEEIFYALDTTTGMERGNLSIRFRKVSGIVQYLNYNPRDHLLYVYNDAYILTYQAVFG